MIALVGVLLLIGGAGDASTAVAADVSRPPHLPRWIWPGAVTVNPRPAPDSTGAPLRTTLCFQLQLGCDALGAVDPIDLATLRVELLAGSERRELVRSCSSAAMRSAPSIRSTSRRCASSCSRARNDASSSATARSFPARADGCSSRAAPGSRWTRRCRLSPAARCA
jgi:hypothetical protein